MQPRFRAPVADASPTQAAWRVIPARQTPYFLPDLVRDRSELMRRFTACYIELRTLPRRARRALQRQWRLPLAGVALMLALGQEPAEAATIRVGGKCTLVDAITAANTDKATGGCPAGQGADRIVLPVDSTITLTDSNNVTYGATGLPVIRSRITLVGRGSTITRLPQAGIEEFRLIAVGAAGKFTLQDTTISGGVIIDRGGAGLANFGGTVAVTNSTISNNYVSGYYGGAGVINRSGTMTITNSTISDNFTDDPAGGVLNHGTMVIRNSTISGNSTTSIGGGALNFGTLTIVNSTVSGNVAGYDDGGGIFNAGDLIIVNSTISGNAAGAVDGNGGGGIFNAGNLTVLSSTISGNTAGEAGSGYGEGGGLLNDAPGTLRMAHTIVAGNTAGFGGSEIANRGRFFTHHHNLFGVDGNAGVEGFSLGATDFVPDPGVQLSDILNPTLANNGGPTDTHALVPGSPAIDAGVRTCLDGNGAPLRTDQRGRPRRVDGDGNGIASCDIGAFEFSPVEDASVGSSP